MSKVQWILDTTLSPVLVVLITCGAGDKANLFSLNRIDSCNAELPMISILVRPSRASHTLIGQLGQFVVNIPWPDMEMVSDFVGATTAGDIDKWQETGLARLPATAVQPPLLAGCPVNLECQIRHTLRLPSHSLFVAEVVATRADDSVLNERQEMDFTLAKEGLVTRAGVVRERPVANSRPPELRRTVRAWSSRA